MGSLLAETVTEGISQMTGTNRQAASFGKAFLELYNSDQFVDMCKTLRVLNAIREYTVGLPLSYQQSFPLEMHLKY